MKDWEEIIKLVYDPTRKALRVTQGPADVVATGHPDFGQFFKIIYDPTDNALKVELLGAPSGLLGGGRDGPQAVRESVNLTKSKLRAVS